MKLKKLVLISLCIFLVSLISCAGLPKKEYERVSLLREKATRYEELKNYSEGAFNTAETDYNQADAIIKAENKKEGKTAKTLLLTAETNYSIVIDKGYPGYAGTLKTETDKEIGDSKALKAEVAIAEEYAAAEAVYNQGIVSLESKDYAGAIEKLIEARDMYANVYNTVKGKYDKSDKSLVDARKKLSDLDKIIKDINTLEGAK